MNERSCWTRVGRDKREETHAVSRRGFLKGLKDSLLLSLLYNKVSSTKYFLSWVRNSSEQVRKESSKRAFSISHQVNCKLLLLEVCWFSRVFSFYRNITNSLVNAPQSSLFLSCSTSPSCCYIISSYLLFQVSHELLLYKLMSGYNISVKYNESSIMWWEQSVG